MLSFSHKLGFKTVDIDLLINYTCNQKKYQHFNITQLKINFLLHGYGLALANYTIMGRVIWLFMC